jgi:anaphase-promoting complex subunit 4
LFSVVLSQIRYGAGSGTGPVEIGLAIVEVVEDTDEIPAMMAADFFDDESLIVVYRVKNHSEFLASASSLRSPEIAYLSCIPYNEIEYLNVPYNPGTIASYEALTQGALEECRAGNVNACNSCDSSILTGISQITAQRVEITRRRSLSGRGGDVGLAVNGRPNRRVVCVLDGTGTRLESFDLGEEDME